jgi:hypothetical protein
MMFVASTELSVRAQEKSSGLKDLTLERHRPVRFQRLAKKWGLASPFIRLASRVAKL